MIPRTRPKPEPAGGLGMRPEALDIRCAKPASAYHPGRDSQRPCRKPNPKQFSLDNGKAASRKKPLNAYGRNSNGSPGKKVATIVKRGKESDSKTAVSHGIQQTMTCSGEKEIHPQRKSADAGQTLAKRHS